MANEQNLKRGGITAEKAPRMGSKGGKKSVESRRRKKVLRECLEILLETEIETDDGKMTGAEAMAVKVFKLAIAGDLKAWELVRDTVGQKPVDKVMVSEVDPAVMADVERIIAETENE